MNIYQKHLRNLIDNKIIVNIYTDIYDESLYGYIIQVSNDLLMLKAFDEIGRDNGIIILRLDDVTRIRWDSKGLQKIEEVLIDKKNNDDLLKINIAVQNNHHWNSS